MIDFVLIILAAIFISGEAQKRKITRWKPLACPECLTFWLYIGINYVDYQQFKYYLTAFALAGATRMINTTFNRYVTFK